MKKQPFIPGETYIPSSGKVYGKEEVKNAMLAAQDGCWTEGRFGKQFCDEFSKFIGLRSVALVNSGSSANLIALAALTSKVFGEKSLKPGDEYITCATGFPTTVNPGILFGLKPIFIDAEIDSFNIEADKIEAAITPKTKLIMIAHTLGKPFNLDKIMPLVKKYNLWLIEDSCDALGSTYNGKLVGTFGHICTFSFYPAHHITMGEGGAVATNNPLIAKAILQFRDWGRDCWCDPGKDDTCGKRFNWKLGELPFGYDHKYIYSQIGFNLKVTDFQPAIGLAQLQRLPKFIEVRKRNFKSLYKFFTQYKQFFQLMNISKQEDPSWFGFPFLVKESAPFSRNEFTQYLESHKVGTRNVFAGNLLRHPAYSDKGFTTVGEMTNSDLIMNQACWIGVYPGIDKQRLDYVKKIVEEFLGQYTQL